MDNPEPNPTLQNLHNQYILLMKQNNGFSDKEAEVVTQHRFSYLKNLRDVNADKLAWIMNTKNLKDENIYLYLIKTENEKTKKITDFQTQR
ncbi:MAG: hypothetical protein K6F04_02530 [bacterium]|nr:hypothetical protein [bacterium]